MVIKLLEKHLQDLGYVVCATKYPQITEYIKEENGYVNILQVIDYKLDCTLTKEQVFEQKNNVSNTVKKDTHIMTIMFYEDFDRAYDCVKEEYMCWLIDKHSLTMASMPEQIQDFYGLRNEINEWLVETSKLLQSGDMDAIGQKLMNQQERLIYEEKKKRKPSPVSVMLVIINTIIYLTSYIIGEPFIVSGQMDSFLVKQGEIYRFVTAMFLHGGLQHLASNMILLYFMGEIVENKTGSVKYAVIYLVSGIMGNVVSYIYEILSGVVYVSVGASGAVYGIIGALLYLVIKKTPDLNIQLKRLLLMVVYCIYSSFATAHVDFAAHIGGMVFGFIITALLCPKGGRTKGES